MISLSELNAYFRVMVKREFEEITADLLLNDFQKTIFKLKYVDKLGNEDIANALNIKLSKVNNELFILRQKLSKLPIFQKQPFDADTSTEYAMRERCRQLGFSKFVTDFCVVAFVEKLSNKKLAEKYNYSLSTVKGYKTLRRKQLNEKK